MEASANVTPATPQDFMPDHQIDAGPRAIVAPVGALEPSLAEACAMKDWPATAEVYAVQQAKIAPEEIPNTTIAAGLPTSSYGSLHRRYGCDQAIKKFRWATRSTHDDGRRCPALYGALMPQPGEPLTQATYECRSC